MHTYITTHFPFYYFKPIFRLLDHPYNIVFVAQEPTAPAELSRKLDLRGVHENLAFLASKCQPFHRSKLLNRHLDCQPCLQQ